jgi:hypothetical protein
VALGGPWWLTVRLCQGNGNTNTTDEDQTYPNIFDEYDKKKTVLR